METTGLDSIPVAMLVHAIVVYRSVPILPGLSCFPEVLAVGWLGWKSNSGGRDAHGGAPERAEDFAAALEVMGWVKIWLGVLSGQSAMSNPECIHDHYIAYCIVLYDTNNLYKLDSQRLTYLN